MAEVLRLKRRPDFLRVAGGRSRCVTPGLILQARRWPEGLDIPADSLRVGFTASRKVGGAVVRNRARRRLKAAVAEIMPRHARPGFDYVLVARGETVKRPYAALVQDLRAALRRLGSWRDEATEATRPVDGSGAAQVS